MSEDIASLGISIDSTQIKTAAKDLDSLKDSGGRAEGSVKALTTATGHLANAVKALAASYAVLKIAEYIKESALLNARYETLGVSMAVVGKNAGYTASQMEAAARGMQKMGISMVESRQQAMRLVQAHISLAESEKLSRIAQDAAVIGNMNSSQAFASMIHGIQTGQTEVLRTIGLNISMERSYKTMADQLNVNVNSLTQNQKTQAILNAVMLAGADIAGTYEAAMDTAGKQLNSMTRYTEDLKLMLGGLFNETLTVAVMAFTDHIKESNSELKSLAGQKELKQWGEDISDVMAGIADNINNAVAGARVLGLTLVHIKDLLNSTSFTRPALTAEYGAKVQAILDTEDRFSRALQDRRLANSQRDYKARAEDDANLKHAQSAQAAYAELYAKGAMSKENYLKAAAAVTQANYGDNHSYADSAVSNNNGGKAKITEEDTAYKQISKSIAEYNAQLNVELEKGTKLTQGENLQIDSKLKLSAAHQALLKTQLDSVLVKEREKAMDDDANKRMEVSLANGEKELSSLEDQLQKQIEHNEVIGLTKAQVDALEASRLDAVITSKETILSIVGENSVLEQQIAVLKELQQAKSQGAARQVVADEAKKTAEEWKKFTSQIETSLTDSLMRGFEGGKGGMKNFIDSLKHTLETAALKIVIQAIVNPVTGAVQSAFTSGGAGGTSATSSLSLLSSLSSGNSSVYAGFNSFAGSSIGQSLGLTNSASFVGPIAPGGSAGLGLTSLGQNLQTALPYLPAVAALAQGNIAQAGLSAVGAYFGGPIGGAIGSFVGGLFGGGGREDPHNNTDSSSVGFKLSRSGVAGFGTGYYADSTTGFNGYAPFSSTYGQTSGSGRWGDNVPLPQATIAAINVAAAQLFTGGASLASGLGLDPGIIDSAAVASGTFASVEAALSELSDAIIKKVIPNIKDFQQANEKLGDTATRLVAEFNLTNLIAKMRGQTGTQAFGSGLAGRDQLVQLLGGASNASTAIGSYYQNYYTDAERKKNAQGEISATLKSLGINQEVSTREQYRALVDAQDLATESGRKMYASLVSIADAFAGITNAATATAQALSTDLFKTRADYIFTQQTGVMPHYAAGGDHAGGWAVVGENGPELANLGPSRVYSNTDSKSLVDFSGLQNEISALRSDLRAGQAAMAHSLKIMEKKVKQWDGDGMPAVRA